MKSKSQNGMILAIVLLCVSIMVLMIYVLSQIVVNQQKSTHNYADIKLAETYAKAAMFAAESRVYYFDAGQYSLAGISASNDTTKNLESPTASCCNLSSSANIMIRRLTVLKNMAGSVDLTSLGQTCNNGNAYKGICYKAIGYGTAMVASNSNSDQAWQPWTLSSTGVVKPCTSYTATNIPMIDDSTYRYSWRYVTGDSSLCTDPRMIVEPISLDFHGNYALSGSPLYESDTLTQNNAAKFTLYKVDTTSNSVMIYSPRIYRITVVAFGKNGDTKVTLQELILINNYDSDLRFSGDLATNLTQRIMRISTRWIR